MGAKQARPAMAFLFRQLTPGSNHSGFIESAMCYPVGYKPLNVQTAWHLNAERWSWEQATLGVIHGG